VALLAPTASVAVLVLRACPVVREWKVPEAPLALTASLAPWVRSARWVRPATAVSRAHPVFLAQTVSPGRLDRMATTVHQERWAPVVLLDSQDPVDPVDTKVPVACVVLLDRAGRRVLAAQMVVSDSRVRQVRRAHAARAARLAATARRASGAPAVLTGPRVAQAPRVPLVLRVPQVWLAHLAVVVRLVPQAVDRLAPLVLTEPLVFLVKWVVRVPRAPSVAKVSRVPAASRAPKVCVALLARPSVVPLARVARVVVPVLKAPRASLVLWVSRAQWAAPATRVPLVYLDVRVDTDRWVFLVARVFLALLVCVEALVGRVYPARVARRAPAVRAVCVDALAALDPRACLVRVVCRDRPGVPVCQVSVDPLASWERLVRVALSVLLRQA